MASFGERLKSLRESKGFTQDELAEKVGVTKQAISQYERGVRRPDFDTLSALCDLFNVSSDFLLGKSDFTTRLLDENELSMVDGYYFDQETAEIAQKIYQNHSLYLLFHDAQDAKPDDLKLAHEVLLAMKRKEIPD